MKHPPIQRHGLGAAPPTGSDADDLAGVDVRTTTVVPRFGRVTVSDELAVHLFGPSGQERSWFMWNELGLGALGAVVPVDARRSAPQPAR
ncbi:hypothetical protein ACH4VX_11815 [Streptomyces sp. NPDC020731]|uniref:hypothetical protein n=1 Tax=Streptomyces sp. NPDC020731 TaxID=3365085 RepID=UPI0037BD7EF3